MPFRWTVLAGVSTITLWALMPQVAAQYGASSGDSAVKNFPWPEGKRVALSLSFDDGRPSQLDNGLPVLDRYGVRATFYVNPGPVEERVNGWRKAASSGHEIGNHSMNHPCTGNFPFAQNKALEDLTLEAIGQDISLCDKGIENLLGLLPRTFAYPCGQKFVGRGKAVQSYVPLIAGRFLAGRGWLDEGPNDPWRCDLAQLLGTELDGLSFEAARELVLQAAERGAWLVFAGHDIGDGGRQTVLVDTLAQICSFSQDPSNGVWIDTVGRIAEYVEEQRKAKTLR